MQHDPDAIKQVAEHAASHIPWYSMWAKELMAGIGVVSLWTLKFIGAKELQRRQKYATEEFVESTINACRDEIVTSIKALYKRNEDDIKDVDRRLDQHLDGCCGAHLFTSKDEGE